jgi:prevent-host-death family protein
MMMTEWTLTDAKNQLSEVITLALTHEPQRVNRRNQSVIIMSEKEYRKLKGKRSHFVEYLIKGPSFEGLELSRDTGESREFNL